MKSHWALFLVVASLLTVARGDTPQPVVLSNTTTQWPLFRGDAQSQGVAKGELPDKPDLLWQVEIKGGAFESSPAIVDGVIYVGDMDGELRAFDLKTGDKKWEYPTDSGFIAPAAVHNGRVYIGDMDGRMHCVDAATGNGKWSFESQAEIDGSANFLGENVLFGSQDSNLYCLNAETGDEVWRFGIADQIRCTPTLIEGHVFVAGCDSRLHIVDANTGKEVRSVPIEAPTGVTPAASGDRVYFGTEAGTFFCIDWKQATIEWQYADELAMQPVRSSPALADDIVVYGGRDKRVKALNPADGSPIWTHNAKTRVDSSPVIVGNRIFVGVADGRLLALDRKSGDEVWQFEARGGLNGSPAVADERLVIASDEGIIYCFGAK